MIGLLLRCSPSHYRCCWWLTLYTHLEFVVNDLTFTLRCLLCYTLHLRLFSAVLHTLAFLAFVVLHFYAWYVYCCFWWRGTLLFGALVDCCVTLFVERCSDFGRTFVASLCVYCGLSQTPLLVLFVGAYVTLLPRLFDVAFVVVPHHSFTCLLVDRFLCTFIVVRCRSFRCSVTTTRCTFICCSRFVTAVCLVRCSCLYTLRLLVLRVWFPIRWIVVERCRVCCVAFVAALAVVRCCAFGLALYVAILYACCCCCPCCDYVTFTTRTLLPVTVVAALQFLRVVVPSTFCLRCSVVDVYRCCLRFLPYSLLPFLSFAADCSHTVVTLIYIRAVPRLRTRFLRTLRLFVWYVYVAFPCCFVTHTSLFRCLYVVTLAFGVLRFTLRVAFVPLLPTLRYVVHRIWALPFTFVYHSAHTALRAAAFITRVRAFLRVVLRYVLLLVQRRWLLPRLRCVAARSVVHSVISWLFVCCSLPLPRYHAAVVADCVTLVVARLLPLRYRCYALPFVDLRCLVLLPFVVAMMIRTFALRALRLFVARLPFIVTFTFGFVATLCDVVLFITAYRCSCRYDYAFTFCCVCVVMRYDYVAFTRALITVVEHLHTVRYLLCCRSSVAGVTLLPFTLLTFVALLLFGYGRALRFVAVMPLLVLPLFVSFPLPRYCLPVYR